MEVLVEVQAEPSEESGALFLGPSPEWMKKKQGYFKGFATSGFSFQFPFRVLGLTAS